ncbi:MULTISPECIES: spore germination protein [Brevibacillus]|jgi:spore germination protein KA|uniref:spore germination protein n=1 Tax=Brevibacillus TaxID=55080 RepID=UPI0030D30D67
MKFIRKFTQKTRTSSNRNRDENHQGSAIDDGHRPLDTDLDINIKRFREETGNSPDLKVRQFELGSNPQIRVAAIYNEGLVDQPQLNEFVIQPLMLSKDRGRLSEASGEQVFHFLRNHALPVGEVDTVENWNEVMNTVMDGNTIIFIDHFPVAIGCNTSGGEWRGIEKPTTELSIRGPKDSFNESISTNISLIRRRIKSPNLWLEMYRIGEITHTDVAIMYMNGIVSDQIVEEVRQRLTGIKVDGILQAGNIEQLIEDQTMTPFPTVYNTERPDLVSRYLLDGRVAIIVDGTPFVLLVPALFTQFFVASDDYAQRYDISSFIRLLRYASFLISLLWPSIYIAAITFHQEMIPTPLLFSLAATREGVPFPALVEALLMELSFEILREAGIRMPRAVGQAVSIVGALVLGQAAVQAGIVSPAMVIVVSITGIASFSTPAYNLAVSARLIRFVLMILAATFGFYTLTLAMIVLVAHLSSLRSFGIPYLSPYAPFQMDDQKDALVRLPLWMLATRTKAINKKNIKKMEPSGHSMLKKQNNRPEGERHEE